LPDWNVEIDDNLLEPFGSRPTQLLAPIKGLEGMAEEITLSVDPDTGEYTRLTRFLPGADTSAFGGKTHAYPEEIFIVSGRLYDQAFDCC